MLIPHKALILTLDGGNMQLLCNEGPLSKPKLVMLHKAHNDNPPDHVAMADRSGRIFESGGPMRHDYEATSVHDRHEQSFGIEGLEILAQENQTNAPVIIVAPPRMLGFLRTQMDETMQNLLIAEVAKDLACAPVNDVCEFLASYGD